MALLRQEVDPSEVGLDPKVLDRMDRYIAHEVAEGHLPGYLVSVARGGRVAHLTTHGHRDVAAGLPVEPDTLWRLYSMTKPVTSVAALLLVEEGRLGLDDPVADHIPTQLDHDLVDAADVVITLGCSEACPAVAGTRIEDWPIDDPKGQDSETVRRIVADLDTRVRELLAEVAPDLSLPPSVLAD